MYVHPRKDVKPPVVTIKSKGIIGERKVKINCACNGMKDARSSRPKGK